MLVHVLGHNLHAAMRSLCRVGALLDPALARWARRRRRRVSWSGWVGCAGRRGCRCVCRELGVGEEHLDLLASEAMRQRGCW